MTTRGTWRAKVIAAETKVVDAEAGLVRAVVSTEAADRDGDILRVAGWDLAHFNAHPILLADHNYASIRAQIGEWVSMEVTGKHLEGVAQYYIGEGNADADWGFKLAGKGRAAFSVGFSPDMDKAKEIKGGHGMFPSFEFNGQELLEVSHVTVPANAEALQALKAKGIHPAVAEVVDGLLADADLTTGSAVKTVSEAMLRLHPDDLAIFEQQIDRFDQLVQESGRQQGRARLRASAIDLDAIVRNAVARALKEAL